ncbi:urease accessory protein UreF [Sinisalibacter aestuarii]|nr:urease accessory UreF family protein [Sinisalibacter aestuarii]
MSTDLLTLAQWLSPAFPVGAFSYSHGLEAAFHAGWISDADSLEAWLADLLTHGAGRSDATLLAAAYRGKMPLGEIDEIARAFTPSAERLLETAAQGQAFAEVVGAVWGAELDGLTYPVALGAAAREGLPLGLTLTLYLQAFTSNLIAAAQRLGPIGQTEGQRILHRLSPLIEATAEAATPGDPDSLASAAFLADIASMRHETQYSRIFRS